MARVEWNLKEGAVAEAQGVVLAGRAGPDHPLFTCSSLHLAVREIRAMLIRLAAGTCWGRWLRKSFAKIPRPRHHLASLRLVPTQGSLVPYRLYRYSKASLDELTA